MKGYNDYEKETREIAKKVKNRAYEIIDRKKATYYGIAMAVKRICEVIVRDEKSILPVSSMLHGEYGINDVVLSMPTIVGKNGIENMIAIPLNEEEQSALKKSADTLDKIMNENL